MKRTVYLLLAVILLYLIPALVLQAVYGPSYGFLSDEDSWVPDGNGGWMAHGKPTGQPPTIPSVDVPIGVRYVPIFLPAAILVLFYLTPLSKLLKERPTETVPDDKAPPDPPLES